MQRIREAGAAVYNNNTKLPMGTSIHNKHNSNAFVPVFNSICQFDVFCCAVPFFLLKGAIGIPREFSVTEDKHIYCHEELSKHT